MKNILTVKIQYPDITVRVILVHAPQETEKLEERSDFFNEFAEQVERGTTSGDTMIVVGDFNARIQDTEEMHHTSSNGKLMKDVIDEYKLKIVNFHERAYGKWTRVQPMKNGNIKKSMLDYFLLEEDMYNK